MPVARGYGRNALGRVIEALESAGIEYEIAEEPAGESPGSWQIRVAIDAAPRATAALATLGAEPPPATARSAAERPGPLFESSSGSLLRALAMALCFGFALWLALR